MRDGVRYRQNRARPLEEGLSNLSSSSKKKPVFSNGTQHLLFSLTFLLLISLTVIVMDKHLPEPKLIRNEHKYPGEFIAERARNHIVNLTSIGPRVAGSYANEVLAVKYLTSAINEIIRDAHDNHQIILNITKHTGSFPLTFLDGMTSVYKNVQNVIVKLGPRRDSPHSLLLNCHFDSFVESPGGSDDGAGCAVMLEILRIMSKNSEYLRHNIIFLFNGAEENLLQASHGFITQHPWAKEVKAFINIEACGAGGRELLFQAGPDNPWIIDVYSEAVPYPYASSLAQEIFQSGIVPGDTDFRIFRDFGRVSGVDFAWTTNGYVYHTKFDTVQQIPLGALQRTGDNILALTREISSSHFLENHSLYNNRGSLVFFDFLGAFVIRWPQYIAAIVNITSILIGVYSIYLNMSVARKELKPTAYLKHLATCIGVICISWAISIICVTSIALILTKLGKVMSWYARPAWLFFLYVCPTIAVSMNWFLYVGNRQRKNINSPWTLYQLYCDAYSAIWMIVLFVCVLLEIRSGFIPLHWVIFPVLGNILRHNFFEKWRDWKWLIYQMGVLSLPYMQSFYLAIGALYLFIPIMGRVGAGTNSEVIMANMLAILFCFLLSFMMPMVILIKNAERVLSVMMGLFFLSIAVLILTPLGFPYSGDISAPAPQRFMILHTHRRHYDIDKSLKHSGSGYWIVDLDMNSPHSVESFVPEIGAVVPSTKDCEEKLFCGLPYLVPVRTFLWKTSWIPGPEPSINIPTKLELISRINQRDMSTFTFNVSGPDHIGIILSPHKDVHLEQWNVVDGEPLACKSWNDRKAYFIYYACSSDCDPYHFTIILKVPTDHDGPVLTIALAGHFLYGENQKSQRFDKFLRQFPSWTVITPWTASYSSWEF
ncbi:endoplasmic reticulum metallopeptidase 1-like [Chelonus insularis]|uniref:endoplasmic reticulum metallopeptidase 1-like n=1 Tax=Chelonus insularis TaxID=460826 RepID=UPI00158842A9|nr:endoplasmic reticulum metallopeptidase 1-like [Chelonus insularis]